MSLFGLGVFFSNFSKLYFTDFFSTFRFIFRYYSWSFAFYLCLLIYLYYCIIMNNSCQNLRSRVSPKKKSDSLSTKSKKPTPRGRKSAPPLPTGSQRSLRSSRFSTGTLEQNEKEPESQNHYQNNNNLSTARSKQYFTRSIASAQRLVLEGGGDSFEALDSTQSLKNIKKRKSESPSKRLKRHKSSLPEGSPFIRVTRSGSRAIAASLTKSTLNKRNSGFQTQIHSLPCELICAVFRNLTTTDLIDCRQVCHQWKSLVEAMCSWKKSLTLTLTPSLNSNSDTDGSSITPKLSVRSLYCQENFPRNHLVGPEYHTRITVQQKYLSLVGARVIGELFSGIDSLVLYFDLVDSRINLIKLQKIIAGFGHVSSFSFIMSKDVKGLFV